MNSIISVLIIVTTFSNIDVNKKTGIWFEEYAVPYEAFVNQGYKITVASIDGGAVPIDPHSMPKSEELSQWKLSLDSLKESQKLSSLDLSKFDAVFIPGGHGAMFDLPSDSSVIQALNTFAAEDKIIASVCHGPASLINITLPDGSYFVKGKVMTSFTDQEEAAAAGLMDKMPFLLESKLKERGASFIDKPNWSDHIEISGNLITGQNPQSTQSVANAVIAKLSGSH